MNDMRLYFLTCHVQWLRKPDSAKVILSTNANCRPHRKITIKIRHLERRSPGPPSSHPKPGRGLLPTLQLHRFLWRPKLPATSVERPSLALCPCLRPTPSDSRWSTGWGDSARKWRPQSAKRRGRTKGNQNRSHSSHRRGRLVVDWVINEMWCHLWWDGYVTSASSGTMWNGNLLTTMRQQALMAKWAL